MTDTDAGQVMAAVDLGSNSFQVVVARVTADSVTQLDRVKLKVAFTQGAHPDGSLEDASMQRGLRALEQIGARLHGFDPANVRAVGTHALRAASNAEGFLERARAALGFSIDVVSAAEEARLVYLGATRLAPEALAGSRRVIVLDIGGGSTEVVLGDASGPIADTSYAMGHGSWTRRFFPDGRVTAEGLAAAEVAAADPLDALPPVFTAEPAGCVGGSGTIRSTQLLIEGHGLGAGGITLEGLDRLAARLVEAGDPSALWLEPVSESRMGVLAGGVAILRALMVRLSVARVVAVRGGLREGALLDLHGRRAQAPESSDQSER